MQPALPELCCDISQNRPHPFVPGEFCQVFDTLHNSMHPWVWSSQAFIGDRSVAPDALSHCLLVPLMSLLSGIQNPNYIHSPVSRMVVPEDAFTNVHVDNVDPLLMSSGCTHQLTAVDRSTHWSEAFHMSSISVEERTHTFCLG